MNDKDREMISSLMDGEWGELDVSRSLADICKNEEQKEMWARYHLARDGMRSESVDETFSIASRVSAALADEPSYTNVTSIGSSDVSPVQTNSVEPAHAGKQQSSSNVAPMRSNRSRWGLGAAGLGIAASAALATVVGLDNWQNRSDSVAAPALVAESTTAPVQNLPALVGETPGVQLVSNRGVYWSSGQSGQRADAEQRLNQLLGDHIEHSPAGNWNGVLPYSRLVGYDSPIADGQ